MYQVREYLSILFLTLLVFVKELNCISRCDSYEINVDHLGSDIYNRQVPDIGSCCRLCLNEPRCTLWTYVRSTQQCWLKYEIPTIRVISFDSKYFNQIFNEKIVLIYAFLRSIWSHFEESNYPCTCSNN